MMITFRVLGILICLCVMLLSTGCGDKLGPDPLPVTPQPTLSISQPTYVPTMAMSGMGTPVTQNAQDDVTYIDMMIPHHQLAIEMANIALEKATHDQLKGLARDIIRAQQDEITRMGMWRMELTGSATPSPLTSGMKMAGMDVDLAKLKASPNFDRDFIVAMIPHHQSAIDMSRAALASLKHAGLHDMAKDVITTQQVEIDRMNGWLETWK